jgi:hypothetical protein
MTVFGIEAAKEIEYLARLRNGLPEVMKVVGESFEFGAVLRDRHVTLQEVVELGFVEDGALELVVEELVLDGGPEGEGIDLALTNDLEDVGRTRGVDPVHDALVHLVPVGVAVEDVSGGGDVAVEAEFAECRLEEHPPFGEVGVGELEGDGNVGADVHRLNNVDSGAGRLAGRIGKARGDRGRRWRSRGIVGEDWIGENWVGIHGCGSVRIDRSVSDTMKESQPH